LKKNKNMKIKTIQLNNINKEQAAIYTLVGIMALLLFAYAYFINASVLFVVERKDSEKKSSALLSQISTLETNYFNASENINISLAYSMGFKETSNISFANRKSIVRRAITLNER